MVEKRHYPRISAELPLGYSTVDGEENYGGMIADVSGGRLLVYLKENLNVSTRIPTFRGKSYREDYRRKNIAWASPLED